MAYCYRRQTSDTFDTVERALRDALKKQGFGVITEIDVQKTVREKLGVEREPYKILGACNPSSAHQALLAEPDIGVLLPCNVIVRTEGSMTFVSAVLPTVQLGKVGNPALQPIAVEIEKRLRDAVDETVQQHP